MFNKKKIILFLCILIFPSVFGSFDRALGEELKQEKDETQIVFRAPENINADFVRYLTKAFKPEKIKVSYPTSVDKLIEMHCGNGYKGNSKKILEQWVLENSHNKKVFNHHDGKFKKGVNIYIPFCSPIYQKTRYECRPSIESANCSDVYIEVKVPVNKHDKMSATSKIQNLQNHNGVFVGLDYNNKVLSGRFDSDGSFKLPTFYLDENSISPIIAFDKQSYGNRPFLGHKPIILGHKPVIDENQKAYILNANLKAFQNRYSWWKTASLAKGYTVQNIIDKGKLPKEKYFRDEVKPRFVELVDQEKAAKDSGCPKSEIKDLPSDWPFDRELVKKIIQRNLQNFKASNSPKNVIVGVVDSGLGEKNQELLKSVLFVNEEEVSSRSIQGQDDDFNGYDDDVNGGNAEYKGDINPFYGKDFASHGSEVVSLALGGPLLITDQFIDHFFSQYFKIKFFKILGQKDPTSFKTDDLIYAIQHLTHRLTIRNRAGEQQYSKNKSSHIINLSLEHDERGNYSSHIKEAWQESQKTLYVVAAGNSEKNINSNPIFPAFLGGSKGDFSLRFITVGALSMHNKPANFSNWGEGTVDIYAPGCNILTKDERGQDKISHGTSMSAPIVSFTLALLHIFRIENAIEKKERLLLTADEAQWSYDGLNKSKISILNIPKAISVFDDIIEYTDKNSDKKVVYGKLVKRNFSQYCNVKFSDMKFINKAIKIAIDIVKDQEESDIYLLTYFYKRLKDRAILNGTCKVTDPKLEVEVLYANQTTKERTSKNIKIANIKNIIFKVDENFMPQN